MSDKRTATVALRLLRRYRANGFGLYPSSLAASLTRCFVSSGIFRAKGAELRTIEMVVGDNPISLASSRIVTIGFVQSEAVVCQKAPVEYTRRPYGRDRDAFIGVFGGA